MPAPRLFISYSHDSEQHKLWVLKLATKLRAGGVDVILDQWDVDLGDDLPRFMEQIVQSDRVLMVCTNGYVTKCNDAEAGGVPVERRLMSGELLKGRPLRTFIPLIRMNEQKELPRFIGGGARYIDFNDDELFEARTWELLASIHGANVPKPPLGPNPFDKGMDAAFGYNGVEIVRGLNLRGFRLNLSNDFYYVTAESGGVGVLARIAINGAIDVDFGNGGIIDLPNLKVSNQFGIERHDLVFSKGVVWQFRPGEEPSVYCSDIDSPACATRLSQPVATIVPDGKRSGMFDIAGPFIHILAGVDPKGPRLIELSCNGVSLSWGRAKLIGEHIYIFGIKDINKRTWAIQRFKRDGVFDRTYGDDGIVILEGGALFAHWVHDLVELPDGRLVAVGAGNEATIVCLTPDGCPDDKFGDRGYVQFRAARRSAGKFVSLQGERIVLVGTESDGRGKHNCFVALLRFDGSYDSSFGIDGSISIVTDSEDELLDVIVSERKATLLFQHDYHAGIRHRIGLARVHVP